MSILVDERTRLLVQGITGRRGRRLVADLASYGTPVTAGVSPGHGGEDVAGVPVFDLVEQAVEETGATTSLVLVPGLPDGVAAVLEAALSGVRLAVWLADPVPVHDMIRLKEALAPHPMTLVGPNTPGIISPGLAKVGFMPSQCYRPGPVGVVSRSGSLSYDVSLRLTRAGIGQSTVVGIGGDPVKGFGLVDAVRAFDADPRTDTILVLGEVGGTEEYALADLVSAGDVRTPVAALLVGATAPRGQKLGHAGAMIFHDREQYAPKAAALRAAGIPLADTVAGVVDAVSVSMAAAA